MQLQMTLSDVWGALDTSAKRRVTRMNVYPESFHGTVVAECLAEVETSLLTCKLADTWDHDCREQLEQQSIDLAVLLPTAITSQWLSETNLVIQVNQRRITEEQVNDPGDTGGAPN